MPYSKVGPLGGNKIDGTATLFAVLWLMLICCESKVLLAGGWLLVWCERKTLLADCSELSDNEYLHNQCA